MISAIIIDDELRAIEELSLMLRTHCPEVNVLATAESVESGLATLKQHELDVVFLDIEMPNQNGFNFLEQAVDSSFSVIFTTAFHEYAIKAIRFSALDYLTKPIGVTELKDAVQRVGQIKQTSLQHSNLLESLRSNKVSTIFLNTHSGTVKKKITEILRFEADGSYTYVFFADGNSLLMSRSLRHFEDLLESKDFVRCHRSHLVNMKHVSEIVKLTPYTLLMTDGSKIPISHRKKTVVLNYFGG